jgi:hypothetical protein
MTMWRPSNPANRCTKTIDSPSSQKDALDLAPPCNNPWPPYAPCMQQYALAQHKKPTLAWQNRPLRPSHADTKCQHTTRIGDAPYKTNAPTRKPIRPHPHRTVIAPYKILYCDRLGMTNIINKTINGTQPMKYMLILIPCLFATASAHLMHRPTTHKATTALHRSTLNPNPRHPKPYGKTQPAKQHPHTAIQTFGYARLHKMRIIHALHLYGALIADHTLFKGTINAHSSCLQLMTCHSKKIYVHGTKKTPTKIYLTHSTVDGPIIIKPHNGLIYKDKQSHIHGKVIGAKILPMPSKKTHQKNASSITRTPS